MSAPDCLWRNALLLDKQVDKGLHGLHLLVGNELIVLGDSHKMNERHVKNVMFVDMPEGVQPVSMVEMGVATEHLFHDTLTVFVESWRETTGLANPLLCSSIRWRVGWSSPGGLIDGKGIWGISHLVGWEHDGVMNFTDDPLFNTVDELGSRDLRGTTIHKPRVSQSRGRRVPLVGNPNFRFHIRCDLPSCRHGWAGGLIANRKTSDSIDLLDNLQHRMKQTVLLDNCIVSVSSMHTPAILRKDRLL